MNETLSWRKCVMARRTLSWFLLLPQIVAKTKNSRLHVADWVVISSSRELSRSDSFHRWPLSIFDLESLRNRNSCLISMAWISTSVHLQLCLVSYSRQKTIICSLSFWLSETVPKNKFIIYSREMSWLKTQVVTHVYISLTSSMFTLPSSH